LTYRAANPIGCIFPIMIMIIYYLLDNKNLKKNIKRKNNKLGKNEEGIPQFFSESKVIGPILPRILKH
jgi:hypothetical protein